MFISVDCVKADIYEKERALLPALVGLYTNPYYNMATVHEEWKEILYGKGLEDFLLSAELALLSSQVRDAV